MFTLAIGAALIVAALFYGFGCGWERGYRAGDNAVRCEVMEIVAELRFEEIVGTVRDELVHEPRPIE